MSDLEVHVADAFVKKLNKLGYQPVFLPRSGMVPPDLYTFVNNRLSLVGPLTSFLPSGARFTPSRAETAGLEIAHTSGKTHAASLAFLRKALNCVGIDSAPKLDLSFASGTDLTFAFGGMSVATVMPAEILKCVGQLDLSALPAEIVAGDELHIAYEYAYAESLLMRRKDQLEFGAEMSASLDQYLDLGTKGEVARKDATTIAFKSKSNRLAAFAFKVGQIRRDMNQKLKFYVDESMLAEAAPTRPLLLARGVVLDLELTSVLEQ